MFEEWFAGYTADVRSRISGASVVRDDPLTEWGWKSEDLPAVLDEVDLKIEHTYRVRDRCSEIADWLKLSARGRELASAVGLLHDIGRFKQAIQFGTMDDRVTGSHGEMSADIFLRDAPDIGLNNEEKDIIANALRYHNVYKLPELTGRSLLFTQIARDGDKLDLFYFYIDKTQKRGFRHIMSEDDGEYSPEMLEGVLNGKNLQISNIQNKNDRMLLQTSMIFDLNFGYSFRLMLKHDYLAHLTGVADGTADETMIKVYNYAVNRMKGAVDLNENIAD